MTAQYSHPQRHLPRHTWRTLLCLVCLLAAAPLIAGEYRLTDLGRDVSPMSINNLGTIVGSLNSGQYPASAFRWTPAGGIEELTGGRTANDVNDAGQIAGNTPTGAFLYDGALLDLGDDHTGGGINSVADIAGSMTGDNPYRASPRPVNPAIYDYERRKWQVLDVAKVYPRGTRKGVYADIYTLAAINDAGYAVGYKYRAGLVGSAAIMTTPAFDAVTFLPIPNGGRATAINNQNLIVGTSGSNSSTGEFAHAFLYDGATVTDLGTLNGGLTSSAADINDLNQVVGSSWLVTTPTSLYEPEKYHAFLWEYGVLTDLNDRIPDSTGWILTAATAINDLGAIVGSGLYDGDGDGQMEPHGFLLTDPLAGPPPAPNGTPPVAVANADVTTGDAPLTVNFSAAGSHDTDGGTITGYAWDFGDGKSAAGMDASYTYKHSGVFTATLTVTDDTGLTDTAQVPITVLKKSRRN